jgi:hypothetical protein
MPNITYPYTFTNGTLANATQVNANFAAVTAVVNGALTNSNLASGAAIALSKLGLNPGGEAFNQSTSGQVTWASGLTTDTQPQIQMTTNAGLQFGPGASTAPDVSLIRSATNTLQIRTPAGGAAIYDGNGGTLQNFDTITLASGGVINLNGGSISGTSFPAVNSGRLYLTSNSPYADTGSGTTLYFGPVNGNQITLYNGSAEVTQTFSQVSLALGSLSASTVYDIYCKSASSTTVVISAVAWSGLNTPPARGTQDGRLTKNGDATNLLVGAIYLNSSSQVTDNTSTRGVSNVYNTISRVLSCVDTTASWDCASLVPQPSNGNTTDGTGRVSFVQCIAEQYGVNVECWGQMEGSSTAQPGLGIGVNSTTTLSAVAAQSASGIATTGACTYSFSPSPGYTYLQRLQIASGTTGGASYLGNLSWFVTGGIVGNCNGLTATVVN